MDNSKDKPTIEPRKNGPYMVKNLKEFKNSMGEAFTQKAAMILCRCGASEKKPFCDGAHKQIGFQDNKEADRMPDKVDNYRGAKITIHDNRGVCSHRGHCTDNSPRVFRTSVEPWIDPDGENSEKTIKTIRMCPSGALIYTKDEVLYDSLERDPAIIISKNGPYDVVGGISLIDPEGNKPQSLEHYTLCRCGHSKNKPFCSGQHWYVDFMDEEN